MKELKIENGKLEIKAGMVSAVLVFLIFNFPFSISFAADTNAIIAPAQYNMMEPYLNSTMRQKLKPAGSEYTDSSNKVMARVASPANVIASNFVRPQAGLAKQQRRVVARNPVRARSASVVATPQVGSMARAAAPVAAQNSGRRVVARSAGTTTRPDTVQYKVAAATTTSSVVNTTGGTTPTECIASYSECMDNYCHRPDTQYDRCYCSAKLAQLDSEYKPSIEDLTRKIAMLQSGGSFDNTVDQDEINDYWKETFGGSTTMADLNSALDIDWAGTENTVRGQNAFIAGDNYCKQHLSKCFYMSENMKSMYRSSIGQDCKKYENNLKKIKYAAEQVIANMQ